MICPPGAKKSLYRGVDSYFNKRRFNKRRFKAKKNTANQLELQEHLAKLDQYRNKFIAIIDKIHLEITEEFSSDDDEVVRIFNQNYRRLNQFYIFILRQIVSNVVYDKGEFNDLDEFFDHIIGQDISSILKK